MSDEITVYWTGFNEQVNFFNNNMWYSDPKNLFKSLVKEREHNDDDSLFRCPAIQSKMLNTYYFENVVKSHVEFLDNGDLSWEGVHTNYVRDPSIAGTKHVKYDMSWVFFADAQLEVSFTAPYFHKDTYLPIMGIPPARFDIGSWFRPFNCEFILWDAETKEITIPSGLPLFYAEFHTDANIRFQRFECTEKIVQYAMSCTFAPKLFGKFKDLDERYEVFEDGHMHTAVMNEINKNLI